MELRTYLSCALVALFTASFAYGSEKDEQRDDDSFLFSLKLAPAPVIAEKIIEAVEKSPFSSFDIQHFLEKSHLLERLGGKDSNLIAIDVALDQAIHTYIEDISKSLPSFMVTKTAALLCKLKPLLEEAIIDSKQ